MGTQPWKKRWLKWIFTWNKVLYRPGKCRCRSTKKDF